MPESEPNPSDLEAAEWVVRLDAGPLPPEEQLRFDAWLAADSRHHGAYVRARSEWLGLERLAALARNSALTEIRLAPPDVRPTTAAGRKIPTLRPSHHGRRYVQIAAGVAAVALLLGALWYTQSLHGQTFASEIGEVRNIELADGSHLTLNTNTRATVAFRDHQRSVNLEQGEALFKVAHDAFRPFVVHANEVHIKAVGTAFTVRVDDTRTDVLVTEGTVEVSREDVTGKMQVRRVTANQRAVLASPQSRPDIEAVKPEVIVRELAWRNGKASFAGEPLGSAAAEINRHSRHPIHVDDPELAARPVVGIFNANDSEGFARAAAATFGATVIRENGEIHLRVPLGMSLHAQPDTSPSPSPAP